jgi:thiamine-monophosphate kinase
MKPATRQVIKHIGEDTLVSGFRKLTSLHLPPSVVVGPGDDTAVVRTGGDRLLLLACDMMMEGVHFRREWATPWQIGWKAMAANLSDIAAMGGEPAFAVASLALHGDLDGALADEIAKGLVDCASRYGAALVGGDLVGSQGPIALDVAITGWVEEDLLLRRSGARTGDALLVTGLLGASAVGLEVLRRGLAGAGAEQHHHIARALQAHLEPRPRLPEAQAVAGRRRATAMIDLSDGLAKDLPRLCAESGLGARVNVDSIPVDPCYAALPDISREEALRIACARGEDYELLLTCPPAALDEIADAVKAASDTPVTVIGEMVSAPTVTFLDASGRSVALEPGFDHFAGST